MIEGRFVIFNVEVGFSSVVLARASPFVVRFSSTAIDHAQQYQPIRRLRIPPLISTAE
jgi:hypothetical protein